MESMPAKVFRKTQMALIRMQFARSMVGRRVSLLGDSITMNLGHAMHFQNFGATGSGSDYIIESIPKWLPQLKKASSISLMTGTNDIWQGYDKELEMRLSVIAKLLPDNVPLIWSTIPPQRDSDRPQQVNAFIKELAAYRYNTIVLDTWDLFTFGIAKSTIPDYFLEDQVHLSPAGYRKWTQALDSHLS